MNNARPTALAAPLDGGLLVEAGAGTGKTYTLTTLAARLVVEAGHSIENLLIVTFTVAATGMAVDDSYTLTTLAARLVVEAGHSIESLLIVTFTVAATGELRTRIWQTLYAARDAVRKPSRSPPPANCAPASGKPCTRRATPFATPRPMPTTRRASWQRTGGAPESETPRPRPG